MSIVGAPPRAESPNYWAFCNVQRKMDESEMEDDRGKVMEDEYLVQI